MKVAGKFQSLIRGVSQQSPELRSDGQQTEQVNLIPDPVEGLTRRWGSANMADTAVTFDASRFAACASDTVNFKTFDYFSEGHDFTLLIRRNAAGLDSVVPGIICYDRTVNQFYPLITDGADTDLLTAFNNGIAAVTSIGKFVIMAANGILPTNVVTNVWEDPANQAEAVIWIRGGAYSRTYSATATLLDGTTKVSFKYTTPSASYPISLDLTGIPAWTPDLTDATTGDIDNETIWYEPVDISATSSFTGYDGQTYTTIVGQTFTLANVPKNNLVDISYLADLGATEAGRRLDPVTMFEGVDYIATGTPGVFQWLATVPVPGDSVNTLSKIDLDYAELLAIAGVNATYVTAPGGTTTGPVYATENTTEPLFIQPSAGQGVSTLAYQDWNVQTLVVLRDLLPMTNVYPAAPGPGQYYWPGGAKPLTFHTSDVGSPYITATYTHTKLLANPNYAKQSNEVTAAYNAEVTKWIGTAAAAIAPQAIAQSLMQAAQAAGLTTATLQGSTIIFDTVLSLSVDDGGDGTLIRGVADVVESVDDVSVIHAVGKVVKVRGKNSKESFYLQAQAKDQTVTSGYTEVIWIEGAGQNQFVDPHFILGIADPVGGAFSVASSPSILQGLVFDTIPQYNLSVVGDTDTNVPPYFVGKQITYLGVFQDRLLTGCGGVIRASQVAQYFNFWRTTVLTIPADDAMEFLSQGSASDVLRYSVLYDQNLILFGLKKQYIINGKVPLTGTNANMVPMSNHANAAELAPLAAGDFIFYAKKGPKSSNLNQIQPGFNTNSPSSYLISSQVDSYLQGAALELSNVAKPSMLFMRTDQKPNSLYAFTYFDTPDGRKQDAWHRWDYNPLLGSIIGMQPTPDGLLIFYFRTGVYADGTTAGSWIVADLQPLDTGLSPRPYVDSQRTMQDITDNERDTNVATVGMSAAYDDSTEFYFLGTDDHRTWADFTATLPSGIPDDTHAYAGFVSPAVLTPTNPYTGTGVSVQSAGHKLTTGRTVVSALLLTFNQSSGYTYTVRSFDDPAYDETVTFNGRIIGKASNVIGREPVDTYQKTLPIGRETREYSVDIKSRKWFPFTITTMDWVGQLFNRTQQR